MKILKENQLRTTDNLRQQLTVIARASRMSRETVANAVLSEIKRGLSGDTTVLHKWAKQYPRTEIQWGVDGFGGEHAAPKPAFTENDLKSL